MVDEGCIRYLPQADVIRAAAYVNVVEIVREALVLHGDGRTTLPAEAHLAWETTDGGGARSLALPGALWGDAPAIGLKVINASLVNTGRGLPRAHGLTLLFERDTARPVAILNAAHLNALRTAAYTAVSVRFLAAQPVDRVAVIGCGPIGAAHLQLLSQETPGARFVLYDRDPDRLTEAVAAHTAGGLACVPASSCEEAVRGAGVVVTATTTTVGYLPYRWLQPGALVAHVSLDDVCDDLVRRADTVLVDDWALVSADRRRLLGRMHHRGDLAGPEHPVTGPVESGVRAVDGTLADVVAGRHPGRRTPGDVILSNPFGMGILDVALGAMVLHAAEGLGLGVDLPV